MPRSAYWTGDLGEAVGDLGAIYIDGYLYIEGWRCIDGCLYCIEGCLYMEGCL